MALVFDGRWRAQDDSGNAYNGATLTVYQAGTTTPASIYTDANLSIASANPLTSTANGYFAQWYAAQGSLFDVEVRTAGGVLLRRVESIPGLGATSGASTWDFTSARFQARASGTATVNVEAGDPVGDDTGGQMRIGGWNGSQLVSLNLDTAEATISGKKLPGVVATNKTDFSAVASVDIALPQTVSGLRAWRIHLFDFRTTGTNLRARLSYDNGATYKSGASDYAYSHKDGDATTNANGGQDHLYLVPSIQNSTKPTLIMLELWTPNSGSQETVLGGRASKYDHASGVPGNVVFTGYGLGSYGRATHLRFYVSSGTITGSYRVEPMFGTGDA